MIVPPGNFEEPKQPYTAQHRDTHDRQDAHVYKNELHNASRDHKAVKSIKERYEVGGKAECIHLHNHLKGKHKQQQFIGIIC